MFSLFLLDPQPCISFRSCARSSSTGGSFLIAVVKMEKMCILDFKQVWRRSSTRAEPLSFRAIKGFGIFTLYELYGRSEKPASALRGRTICRLAPQKDDYQSELFKIIFFGVPNP